MVGLSEAFVARQHQLSVDQSQLLVGVECSCQEQVSIGHPEVPSV